MSLPAAGQRTDQWLCDQNIRGGKHVHDLMRGAALHLAAKSGGSEGEQRWLPLWVHSADTCGVALYLLKEWLPVSVRKAICRNMTEEQLISAGACAAILHDLGKASALFQTRIAAGNLGLREKLRAAGLQALSDDDASFFRNPAACLSHAATGEILLLRAGCELTFAEIIWAHHGQPWEEGRRLFLEEGLDIFSQDMRSIAIWGRKEIGPAWRETQRECLRWMLKSVNIPDIKTLPAVSQTTVMLLTGLVIMADWIASNETYFPLIPLNQNDPGDLDERLEQALKELNLPPPWQPTGEQDLCRLAQAQFGFSPNAVQRAMADAARESITPGLMILEAPMGLGKTEAALLTADVLAERGVGGIFFGLPTQATANAIFDRVTQWGKCQSGANQISIRLAHGMADLNERYCSLMKGERTSQVEEDGDKQERLVVHEWFRGSKQALLAGFVVGTVDQVLMASLRQKHLMLRHLGLSGKTVIIDECHAYDAYMNQYLERTLAWLGSYRTPVLMLSATLPAAQRRAFVNAYLGRTSRKDRERSRNEEWSHNQAYPVLTWTDGQEVQQTALRYDGIRRDVKIERMIHGDTLEDQADAVSRLLKEKLAEGGCAAVVLNTVHRAQCIARRLQEDFGDENVILLHSRFVMPDRLRLEQELLDRMGKSSDAKKRHRIIAVGTQVIEQSLDFDADVMISDLCPMDLLLQRIGRLHRHAFRDARRPEGLHHPVCHILCAGNNEIEKGAEAVYGAYLLMRTRMLLPQMISLPDDIAFLVNAVYDEEVPLPEVPEDYEKAREKDLVKRKKLENEAGSFRIHDPGKNFSSLLSDGIPPDEDTGRAQVRAGEQSFEVLLLTHLASGEFAPLPWLRKGERWSSEQCPTPEDARAILAQRISLPIGLLRKLGWERLREMLALPEPWRLSPWLRHAHLLVLDENLTAVLDDIILTYRMDTGLEYKKRGEAS